MRVSYKILLTCPVFLFCFFSLLQTLKSTLIQASALRLCTLILEYRVKKGYEIFLNSRQGAEMRFFGTLI